MSSGGVQDFEAGTQPEAELFNALVAAVRELLVAHGAFTHARRPARHMRTFTPAGRAIALTDAHGDGKAQATEMLWQMGPHVKVLPTAAVDGVQTAIEEADAVKEVELYEKVKWATVAAIEGDEAPNAYTLEPEETTCTAQAMPDDPNAPTSAPTTEEEEAEAEARARTGNFLLGCVRPTASARGQKQRMLAMWPMPQHPLNVYKSGTTVGYHCSEPFLLPSPDCDQVLTCAYVACYDAITIGGRLYVHYAELMGRLDKHGRLGLRSSLYYAGQRPRATS